MAEPAGRLATEGGPRHRSLTSSVVICAYTQQRWAQIQQAIDSVTRQTVPPSQVIVVADHNQALRDRLAARYPALDVISNTFDRGLSGARNSGVERAEGDIVVFLDDDARAEPDWLEKLLACYEDESVLGAGGMVAADWATARGPRWLPEEFLWVVGCSYAGLPEARAQVRNPVGANMSFRRYAFAHAGLFNSSIGRNETLARPVGDEETEFSIRLLAAAPEGRIVYEPRAVVHHYVDQSRESWRYFLDRCYSEGLSKARVARLAGMSAALSAERHYVIHTIIRGARRELRVLVRRGQVDALGRLAAMALGVLWAAAGYLWGTATQIRLARPPEREPE